MVGLPLSGVPSNRHSLLYPRAGNIASGLFPTIPPALLFRPLPQDPSSGALAGRVWAWEGAEGDRATERLRVAGPGRPGLQALQRDFGGAADVASLDWGRVDGTDQRGSRAELCTPAPGQSEPRAKGLTDRRLSTGQTRSL